jgi:AcrR family transcriptional regulator
MPVTSTSPAQPRVRDAPADRRERILHTAYDLFQRHGLQAIGVDRIVAEAGVAKMTLYRHFRSKDELVLAVLDRREELWARSWLEREIERRGSSAEARLLATFDVFDEWFRRDDYEGCTFVNSLLEVHDRTSPIGSASVLKLAAVRAFLQRLADEAGVDDPEALARQWQLLMMGAMVAAAAGDVEAARRAREVAELLLERHTARS